MLDSVYASVCVCLSAVYVSHLTPRRATLLSSVAADRVKFKAQAAAAFCGQWIMNCYGAWRMRHEAGTWTRTRYQCKLKWPTWRCPIDEQRQRQRSKAKRSQSHLKFNEFLPNEKFCGLGWITGRQDDVERRMTGTSRAPDHVNWLRAEAKQVPHATCRMPQRRLHYEWFGQQIATNCLQFKLNSISFPFPSPSLSLSCSFYPSYLHCSLSSAFCHAPA